MLINACGAPTIVDDLETYRNRLAAVLEQSFPDVQANISLRFPPAQTLRIDIPRTTISMRDFYALSNCHVTTLIAQRNTALGKVQLPSVRLVYEYEVVSALEDCIDTLQDNENNQQQRQQLQLWIEQKRLHFHLVWASFIQHSSELKATFSSNQSLLSTTEPAALNEYQQALTYLLSLSKGASAESGRVETSLDTLRSSPFLAQLWRSQTIVTRHLDDLTVRLQNLTTQLDCKSDKSKQQVEYLSNVFRLYFVERIQPFGSNINQIHYTLSPIVTELSKQDLSPAFTQYLSSHLQQFDVYQHAMRTHVEFWQSLFAKCEISPKKSF